MSAPEDCTVLGLLRVALTAAFLAAGAPGARAAEPIPGAPALAGAEAKVGGTLTATPARSGGPLALDLDIVMTPAGGGEPIRRYEPELSKEMHVIAVDEALTSFVHEHVGHVPKDGHARLTLTFPKAGWWHVYADATPAGLGQQVLRFDLPVGEAPLERRPPALAASGTSAKTGPYTLSFNTLDLKLGEVAMLKLRVLKDGEPARDLRPYLGVPAHLVMIGADDLAYVHAHPMGGTDSPAELTIHVAPPRAEAYALWIQFRGGGKLYTVPFVAEAR